MLTKTEIREMREERVRLIVGPNNQKDWNKKMFQRPFTGLLFFEVNVLPDFRVHLPCHISTQGKTKHIQLDTGYFALSVNEYGRKYFESLDYSVTKGLIRRDFPKSGVKAVVKEYIQSMIKDIDAIGHRGFKDYA